MLTKALGDSWAQIFFFDSKTNSCNSLAQIKYLIKGPKKPVSGFLFFAADIRNNIPNDADFARKSGEMWKDLPESQREVCTFPFMIFIGIDI